MSRNALVIDTSAIIAEIKDEPGAEAVRQVMAVPPTGGFFMHAINVCEVAYHLIKFGFIESIAYELATPDGVTIIDDIRPVLWQRAASLRVCRQVADRRLRQGTNRWQKDFFPAV